MNSATHTATVENTNTAQAHRANVAQIIESLSDKAMSHIPMHYIRIVEGFNPRRGRDPVAFQELKDSIAHRGVQQPIIVRPADDNSCFEVVAGHGRFEANEQCGHDTIPAIVRLVSLQEAVAISLLENMIREGMSVIEEAEAARRMLSMLDGDHTETAKTLGWDRQLLDRRLALLHCTMKVRDALIKKEIKIGHAELLAGLSEEMQLESLDAIISKNISVADFKSAISRYAYQLSDAIFCKDDCSTCPHNSSQTSDLFDSSLSGGQCLDRGCFDEKTKHALNAQVIDLKDKYSTVFLDTESDPKDRIFLSKSGDTGVGTTQFDACKGCAHFGVVIHSSKGKEGRIDEDLCFNLQCHNKKVKAYQKPIIEGETDKISLKGGLAKDAVDNSTPAQAKRAKVEGTPKRVIEFCNKAKLKIATNAVASSHSMVRIFTAKTLYEKLVGHGKPDEESLAGKVLAKHPDVAIALASTGRDGRCIKLLSEIDHMTLDLVISALAGSIAGEKSGWNCDSSYVPTAVAALKATETKIEKEWCVSKEYLETLTKSGLDALAKDAGFDSWFEDANSEGAYLKLTSQKRDVIIKRMISSGFQWDGYIPEEMNLKD